MLTELNYVLLQLGNFTSEDNENEAAVTQKNKENTVMMIETSPACLQKTEVYNLTVFGGERDCFVYLSLLHILFI